MPESSLTTLKSMVGKKVAVRTQDGFEAEGTLDSVDDYMNLSLIDCERVGEGGARSKIGKLHVKGENLVFVSIASS